MLNFDSTRVDVTQQHVDVSDNVYRSDNFDIAYSSHDTDYPPSSFTLALSGLVLTSGAMLCYPVLGDVMIFAALAGLIINAVGIASAIGSDFHLRTSARSLRQFTGLLVDLGSIATLLIVLVASANLQLSSALVAVTAYLVVLLCGMIKSNALRKSGHAKWQRAGWFARGMIALVLIGQQLDGHAIGLHLETSVQNDWMALIAGSMLIVGGLLRALGSGVYLAARDPSPAGPGTGGSRIA